MSNTLKVEWQPYRALRPIVLLCLILVGQLTGQAGNAPNQEPVLLQAGQIVQRELAPEQKHVYKIVAAANQYVGIKVEQQGLDVVLVLLGPGGEQIFELDTPNGRDGPEQIGAALADAGDYSLEVRANEKGAPAGRYAAQLIEVRDATADDFKSFRATRDFIEARQLIQKRAIPGLRLALTKLAEAERLRVELGDKRGQLEAIVFTGICYQVLGEQKTAIETYQRAIPLAKEAGAVGNEAMAYNNLGFIYYRLDDFQNALYYMRLGIETLSQAGREEDLAVPLGNIGTAYTSLGEPEKAIDYFHRAQVIAHKYNLRNSEAHSEKDLAAIYAGLGDHQRALAMQLEALPVLRQTRDIAGVQSCLGHIANAYFALGDDQNALEYFGQALKHSIESKSGLEQANTYYGLGRVYDRQGDLPKAIDNFKMSLDLFSQLQTPRLSARALRALAESEFKAGQFSQAESDMRKAIELIESVRSRISTQELRTSFFSQSNREIYESYISLLMGLHKQAAEKGYDKEAFAASEKARARSLLELLAVARTDIRQGIDKDLLDRERGLRTKLNDKIGQLSRLMLARAAEDRVSAAQSDYAKSEEELQQVEAQIRKASPRYAALMQSQTVSLTEAQTLLDKDSALLEYSLGKNRSYLWVITSDSVQTVELPKRDEIEKAARAVYELLTARNRTIKFETIAEKRTRVARSDSEVSQAASLLSRMVLAPAASALTKKRMLIVPDGGLYYVPFAILPTASLAGAKAPLVTDAEVVNLPSASALAALRKQLAGRLTAPRAVAIFADPVFDREDERYQAIASRQSSSKPAANLLAKSRSIKAAEFSDLTRAAREVDGENVISLPRLPFTRKEAEAIKTIASGQQSQSLLDFSARRGTVLDSELSQYRIIHFATHSFISSAHPEVSGIVLSLIDEKGDDRDGFIRASDIYNLKLQADLVVLSGCRTGLGKEIRGEGLTGMTQSFMYAGAARVMVSLWDVQDEATAELMKRFYHGLFAERLSPAAALRNAQQSMAQDKRWSAPYYWAGFTLQGEPR